MLRSDNRIVGKHRSASRDGPMGASVTIESLAYSYGGTANPSARVIETLSCTVKAGEFVAIVGPSGCGKSTLLSLVAGVLGHRTGSIKVDGDTVAGLRRDVGLMFQRDALLPWRRVLDNIALPLIWRGEPKRDARRLAATWVRNLGLEGYENHYPSQLSGGMRKRVQLAMSLIYLPRLLLMDEPFASLDVQTRDTMEDDLLRIWEEGRNTVVLVTHDLEEAIALSDRVVVVGGRPARVKSEHVIDLARPRHVLEERTTDKFQAIYRTIWADLRSEVKRTTAAAAPLNRNHS